MISRSDDPNAAEFGDQVHFTATVLLPQMRQPVARPGNYSFGAQLRHHECLDDAAEQGGLCQHVVNANPENSGEKAGIDDVAFGGPGESLEAVRRPRRQLIHHR